MAASILKRTGLLLAAAIALLIWLPGFAQTNAPGISIAVRAPRPDWNQVEIKTTRLADDFYILEAQGSPIPVGTVSVLTGPDGVLIVDSQFGQLSDKLVAAISKRSDKPIRFLVNTHSHADHVGGNPHFAQLGALILGRDALRERLEHPGPRPDGSPGVPAALETLPVVTYDGPRASSPTSNAASGSFRVGRPGAIEQPAQFPRVRQCHWACRDRGR